MPPNTLYKPKTYTVSEFVQTIRNYLKEDIGPVVIQGEVTNFRQPKGNLIYFELKDEESRILCFMLSWELKVPLEDGTEIRVLGVPSLFKGSGGFHIRVQEIELVGEGALRKALEALKMKLEKEGLFAPERKRALPLFPSRIGLITSPDAAAYTDVLKILKNRWSGLAIKFFPVAVQGLGSISQITQAFEYFNQNKDVEVIILTRGGGSLEDLQSFNSEEVLRAIFASQIPVVCGVGHERDITLADLVADVRASTPSNAAEIVVPDRREIANQIDWKAERIEQSMQLLLENMKGEIELQVEKLETGVSFWQEKFTYLEEKLKQNFEEFVRLAQLLEEKLVDNISKIRERFSFGLERIREKILNEEKLINTLSPQATLNRGYSLTYRINPIKGLTVKEDKQRIIKDSNEVNAGETIKTRLSRGEIESEVKG